MIIFIESLVQLSFLSSVIIILQLNIKCYTIRKFLLWPGFDLALSLTLDTLTFLGSVTIMRLRNFTYENENNWIFHRIVLCQLKNKNLKTKHLLLIKTMEIQPGPRNMGENHFFFKKSKTPVNCLHLVYIFYIKNINHVFK